MSRACGSGSVARGRVAAALVLLLGCADSHAPAGYDCTGNPCDDGDACNGVEVCDAERGCLAGTPMSCDDDDPCTVDSCAAGACAHAPRDLDGDGHADRCAGGDDCAPLDPSAYPGAPELCNGRDDDCDLEVDEGLPFGVVSETVLPEHLGATAFLEGGSLVGVRTHWVTNDADSPLEAFVYRDGALETEFLEDGAYGHGLASRRLLTDGRRVLFAWGELPLIDDFLGNRWHSGQAIQVFDVQADRDPIAREIATYWPDDDEMGRPLELRMDWMGSTAIVAWIDQRWGRERILVALPEREAAPHVVAEPPHATQLALAADPTGATLVWNEDGATRATRVDSSADASGAVAAVLEGDPYEHYNYLHGACATPWGTAVLTSWHDIFAPFQVSVVRRDLTTIEPLVALDEPQTHRAYTFPEMRCVGTSVLLLNDARGDDGYPILYRLRRITAEGIVDFEETIDADWAWFATATRTIVLAISGETTTAIEYGCEP